MKTPITAPPNLTPEARAIFDETVAACDAAGHVLNAMDRPLVAIYAASIAEADLHEAAIGRDGWTLTARSGYTYPNPRCSLRDAALKRATQIAIKIGLARLDRRRIPKTEPDPADDPFAKFIEDNDRRHAEWARAKASPTASADSDES